MGYQVQFSAMPLAVYRELSAHLQQVRGVETELLLQHSHQFDYNQSQVGGLWIECATEIDPLEREQLGQILAYYSDRYGPYQTLQTKS